MAREYNYQYFTRGQVEDGRLDSFLRELYSSGFGENAESYNDIHIYNEDFGAIVVEWAQVWYDGDISSRFEFVGSNQVVL